MSDETWTETHRDKLVQMAVEARAWGDPHAEAAAIRAALAEIARLQAAIHLALANGDRTRLGTVRPILADAVNTSVRA